MADSMIPDAFDIVNRYGKTTEYDPTINYHAALDKAEAEQKAKDKSQLSFTDMLSLMVAQFQYQSIDNQADTTDMMNQLVQMSSMQAMTEMTTQLKEVVLANVMTYSASLVGQYVTLGLYDSEGKLQELYGQVEGAGTYDGQQVIFVGGKSYALSSIMAVGKLPPRVDETEEGDKSDKVEETPDTETKDTEDGEQTEKVPEVDEDGAVG